VTFSQQPGRVAWAGEGVLRLLCLQGLVLSSNPIGDPGVCALAAALQHNISLRMLDLSNTGMAETGIIMLAATLAEHNRSINTLAINSPLLQQRPQFDTVVHLARMLAMNDALQVGPGNQASWQQQQGSPLALRPACVAIQKQQWLNQRRHRQTVTSHACTHSSSLAHNPE